MGSTTLPRVLPTILSAATANLPKMFWLGANHRWSAHPIRRVVIDGRQTLHIDTEKTCRGPPGDCTGVLLNLRR
jgi:hypothetical protein